MDHGDRRSPVTCEAWDRVDTRLPLLEARAWGDTEAEKEESFTDSTSFAEQGKGLPTYTEALDRWMRVMLYTASLIPSHVADVGQTLHAFRPCT